MSNSPEVCSTGCNADDQQLLIVGIDAVGLVNGDIVPESSLGVRRWYRRRQLLEIKRLFAVSTCFRIGRHLVEGYDASIPFSILLL